MRRFALGLVVLVISVTLASAMAAGKGDGKKGDGKKGDGKKGDGEAQAVASLQAAHKLLSEGKHDYHGHRHKAAENVADALKALGHDAKNGGKKDGGKKGGAKKEAAKEARQHESQATSDMILRDAEAVLAHLRHASGALKKHKAQEHINKAIAEIELALKVK